MLKLFHSLINIEFLLLHFFSHISHVNLGSPDQSLVFGVQSVKTGNFWNISFKLCLGYKMSPKNGSKPDLKISPSTAYRSWNKYKKISIYALKSYIFPNFWLKLYLKVKTKMLSVFPDLKYMDIATKGIRISLQL